jgi:uncharacterized protein (TIGR00297 family)
MQLFLGFLFVALIGFLAYRAIALSPSVAWGATLTGGLIFGLVGISWAVLLLTFFISSSVLSRLFARNKSALGEKFSKGSQRDLGQVLANGGLGALLAVVYAVFPGQDWPWIAFAGAMAAVNADTWATELGVLSKSAPRLITTFQPVERGTSGAVSWMGSLAALGGASLVGIVAALLTPWWVLPGEQAGASVFLAAAVGGVAGSFFDSLLGATLQAIYWCPQCQKETERHPLHTCETQTLQRRGLGWMNNDVVNFLASLAGAFAAVFLGYI